MIARRYGLNIRMDPKIQVSESAPAQIKADASVQGNEIVISKDTTITINAQDNATTQLNISIKQSATLTIQTQGRAAWHLLDTNITIKPNVQAQIVVINKPDHVLLVKHTIYQKKDSVLDWYEFNTGATFIRSEVITHLQQPGATNKTTMLYIAQEKQKYDLYTAAYHESDHTYSDLVTKGAVKDKAQALARGLINIGKDAPDSEGYEKQDAILLDSTAEADAIPNLEIHNQNVKCSHGSTVGQVDKEQLFYLKSRGMSEHQAKRLIILGYFTPILDKAPHLQELVEASL